MPARTVELLSRTGCHLCDDARRLVERVTAEAGVGWTETDAVLAALADLDYVADLKKTLDKAEPIKDTVAGVTGDLLFKKETPHGLILFGGKGANTYHVTTPVALLVDLGGGDTYKGVVAASADATHANGVVIDLGGDDAYEPGDFGLATGRAGIGRCSWAR